MPQANWEKWKYGDGYVRVDGKASCYRHVSNEWKVSYRYKRKRDLRTFKSSKSAMAAADRMIK